MVSSRLLFPSEDGGRNDCGAFVRAWYCQARTVPGNAYLSDLLAAARCDVSNTPLLEQFLSEECTPYVRHVVLQALNSSKTVGLARMKRFEFNRFDLTIDYDEGVATVEDILDATAAGSQRVSLAELASAIDATAQ
jgi:hypothetical protein